MHERRAAAALASRIPRRPSSRRHRSRSRVELAIRPGAAHEREQLVLAVLARTTSRRRSAARGRRAARRARRCDRARRGGPRAAARRIRRGRRARSGRGGLSAVPEIVWPERPTRCSSVAMRCGDPIWQTRSTWPMSMPSSSDAVATSAFSAPFFRRDLGVEALLLRQAAVVRGDGVVAEPVAEVARDALGHAARVDEDQRRAVLGDQLREAVVVLLPHLVRHHRLERRARDLDARGRSARRWPSSMIGA